MKPKLKPLHEQVVVVTGASSGIGLVTARLAVAKGAKVLFVARSEEALRIIVKAANSMGGTAAYAIADVADAAMVEEAAAYAVQRFGRIDSWINVAGAAIYAKLTDTPADEHERLFQTNYFGVVNGCLAAVPRLQEGGALITVGSMGSDVSIPLLGAYAASKHAVKAYVETLRMELGASGSPISVTLIKPSGINTPVGEHAANHIGGLGMVPPPRYDPRIAADAIIYCAQHRLREITVGGSGRLQVLLASHFPSLFEKIAPGVTRFFTDQSRLQPIPSNLFEAAHAGRERAEGQTARQFSIYTSAAKHPEMMTVLGLAAVATAVTIFERRKQVRRQSRLRGE